MGMVCVCAVCWCVRCGAVRCCAVLCPAGCAAVLERVLLGPAAGRCVLVALEVVPEFPHMGEEQLPGGERAQQQHSKTPSGAQPPPGA